MSNKYYFDKEIAFPFNLVYKLGMGEAEIEKNDFLKELFNFTLWALNGRINGATYLLEEAKIGEPIDMGLIEAEDMYIFEGYEDCDFDAIIYNEECQAIAIKRLKALETFRDAIEILNNMFYKKDFEDLEKLVQANGR